MTHIARELIELKQSLRDCQRTLGIPCTVDLDRMICYKEMTVDTAVLTPCLHIFCRTCLLAMKDRCACCRTPFRGGSETDDSDDNEDSDDSEADDSDGSDAESDGSQDIDGTTALYIFRQMVNGTFELDNDVIANMCRLARESASAEQFRQSVDLLYVFDDVVLTEFVSMWAETLGRIAVVPPDPQPQPQVVPEPSPA